MQKSVFQRVIDAAADPKAKADAQRAMAMSYAFDGDCANTVKYEQMVIAYWVTREQAEPQNAFYQEGEMANEAARVCIDAGDLAAAEKWYRAGTGFGLKEPGNQTHPKSLWDFRLAHALGRLAARRNDKAEAARQVAAARKALDSDPAMAAQQERFFPYLVGYVALYTNDLKTAEAELTRMLATAGNQNDPFMNCLLAMTYEKLGQADKARAAYQKAYGLATAHNPPAAFTRAVREEEDRLTLSRSPGHYVAGLRSGRRGTRRPPAASGARKRRTEPPGFPRPPSRLAEVGDSPSNALRPAAALGNRSDRFSVFALARVAPRRGRQPRAAPAAPQDGTHGVANRRPPLTLAPATSPASESARR